MSKSDTKKKKHLKHISHAVLHVHASLNNTIVTVTDLQGNVVAWSSSGSMGFKGSRKSTPFAAQMAGDKVGKVLLEYGVKTLEARINGAGPGRESALRALSALGVSFTSILDITGLPHNGCRPPKESRK
jgi:small subunit ribosomal protein S11